MYEFNVKLRVRYAETDQMGYCYYGNYAAFFEVARVEAIRSLGFSYKQMEDEGIALPVLDFSIKYYKPAALHPDFSDNPNAYVNKSPFGRLAYEITKAAISDGINFLYGTPNTKAFPGWVNKLGPLSKR